MKTISFRSLTLTLAATGTLVAAAHVRAELGPDKRSVGTQTERLRKTLDRRSRKISKQQYAEISQLLEQSIEIAMSTEADVQACRKDAPAALSEEQRARLCKAGSTDSVVCFEAASSRLTTDQRVALCELGGDAQRVTCYDSAPGTQSADSKIRDCVAKSIIR